ncbi:COG2426 family protein [Defluviitalea phaphyphila]|uniref:COG2426 family protein n=1 Tax=Defluviitalea phaphyphila TaxID=1473580 RepID=UPI000730913E|nr:small multi-drug export protein [Defluviitalea phaphyphila]
MNFISKELKTLFISAIPVLEQKAAIPYGIIQGIGFWEVYFLTLIGAVLPSPFIILFVNKIFNLLKKVSWINPFIKWIEKRTMKKSKNIVRYELLGLFLFVAIPLPGTGVWTGSIAASLLHLEFKKSILTVFLGAGVSGVIISILSYGVGILF